MKYLHFFKQTAICLLLFITIFGCDKNEGIDEPIIDEPIIKVTSPMDDEVFFTGEEIPVNIRVTGSKIIQVQISIEAYSGILILLSEVAELNKVSSYEYTGSCIVSGVVSYGTPAALFVKAIDDHGNLSIEVVTIELRN